MRGLLTTTLSRILDDDVDSLTGIIEETMYEKSHLVENDDSRQRLYVSSHITDAELPLSNPRLCP